LLKQNGSYALHKRSEKGLLSGMWEFPNCPSHLSEQVARDWLEKNGFRIQNLISAGKARHLFSHVEWDMIGFFAEVEMTESTSLVFADPQSIEQTYSMPTAFKYFRNQLAKMGNSK
jgi:A/G-specific adenine glycosylase